MTADPTLFPRPRRKTQRRGRGQTLRVEVVTRHTVVVRGQHVVGLIDGAQIPAKQWSPAHRAWMISRRRVDDLIAFAEHEGRVVTVEGQP